jgi:hypothetical protein
MSALNFTIYFFDATRLLAHTSDLKGKSKQKSDERKFGEVEDEEANAAGSVSGFQLLNQLHTSTPQQGLVWHPAERVLFGYGGSDTKVSGTCVSGGALYTVCDESCANGLHVVVGCRSSLGSCRLVTR